MKYNFNFPFLFDISFTLDEIAFNLDDISWKFNHFLVFWKEIIVLFALIGSFIYFIFNASKKEEISKNYSVFSLGVSLLLGFFALRLIYAISCKIDGEPFMSSLKDLRGTGSGYVWAALTIAILSVFYAGMGISPKKALDAISSPLLMLNLAYSFGNIFNPYKFKPCSQNYFWRMFYVYMKDETEVRCVHPTFLYGTLWFGLGLAVSIILYKKKKFDGQLFFFAASWASFGKIIMDAFLVRQTFGLSSILIIFVGIASIGAYIYFFKKSSNAEQTA